MIFKVFGGAEGFVTLLLRALYLIDSQYEKGYRLTILSILFMILVVGGLLGGIIWLVWKDFKSKSKKEKTGTDSLVGKEAEVMEVSSFLKKGWASYQGENWKISSIDNLKVGDIVTILSYKRMTLKVKKQEGINE